MLELNDLALEILDALNERLWRALRAVRPARRRDSDADQDEDQKELDHATKLSRSAKPPVTGPATIRLQG